MDCATSIVKYLLFAFNLLCSLAGLGLIIMGALVNTKMSSIVDAVDHGKFDVPAVVVIVLGSIIFILSFLGCCGAARESHGMLISYSVLLCCVFVVQVVIAVLAFVYRDSFNKIVEENLTEIYGDYKISSDDKALVDDLQHAFECCGLHDPSFWKSVSLPQSCCDSDYKGNCTLITPNRYKKGCLPTVLDVGSWAGNVVGGVAIGICVVEVVGIVFGCCLANSIKNEERRKYT
ncbi:CD63 antigen-like [Hetaerina americana]|uniref:CD63 antigen-like n=1 Tax=Hetaerina americana TaxID=62018 RepID=UPI003A7F2BC2